MAMRFGWSGILVGSVLVVGFGGTAWAGAEAKIEMPDGGLAAILAIIGFVFVLALLWVNNSLARAGNGWSLVDALSEESEQTATNAAGEATTAVRMIASSSRLIALLGLMGILTLFMGCGAIMLWILGKGGNVKENAESYSTFLMYGVVMFAPYMVNKFSAIFEKFGPPRG